MPAVEVEDTLDVGLHPRAGVNDTRALLDFGIEILVVELVVSLERDAVDDRVFDDLDDKGVADPAQIHVGKQTGCEQRLQRRVQLFVIPRFSRLDLKIRTHRLRLDPLSAEDLNVGDDSAPHRRHGRHRDRSRRGSSSRRPAPDARLARHRLRSRAPVFPGSCGRRRRAARLTRGGSGPGRRRQLRWRQPALELRRLGLSRRARWAGRPAALSRFRARAPGMRRRGPAHRAAALRRLRGGGGDRLPDAGGIIPAFLELWVPAAHRISAGGWRWAGAMEIGLRVAPTSRSGRGGRASARFLLGPWSSACWIALISHLGLRNGNSRLVRAGAVKGINATDMVRAPATAHSSKRPGWGSAKPLTPTRTPIPKTTLASGHQPFDKLDDPKVDKIVPRGEHHQGKYQGQPDAKAVFLGAWPRRPPAKRLGGRGEQAGVRRRITGTGNRLIQPQIDRQHRS